MTSQCVVYGLIKMIMYSSFIEVRVAISWKGCSLYVSALFKVHVLVLLTITVTPIDVEIASCNQCHRMLVELQFCCVTSVPRYLMWVTCSKLLILYMDRYVSGFLRIYQLVFP